MSYQAAEQLMHQVCVCFWHQSLLVFVQRYKHEIRCVPAASCSCSFSCSMLAIC